MKKMIPASAGSTALPLCSTLRHHLAKWITALTLLALPLAAQTLNVNAGMSANAIANAVRNASANTTIIFANGTYQIPRGGLWITKPGITIQGSGDLGTTLDGGFRGGPTIYVNAENVTVRNLRLIRAETANINGIGRANGAVHGSNADNLRVDGCDIEVERTQGGVYLNGGGGQTISNNTIYNPLDRDINFEFPADLIYIQNTDSNGWLIEGNTLRAKGRPTRFPTMAETLARALHVDNIQLLNCRRGTINANTITIDIDIERHFHGVLIENKASSGVTGTFTISNNYMVNYFTGEQKDAILKLFEVSGNQFFVYHNTIVGNSEQLIWYKGTNPNSQFKNNILYRRQQGRGPIVKMDPGAVQNGSSNGQWSHNLFYNQGSPSGNVVDSLQGWRNTAAFDTLTGGSGSVFGNPRFADEGPEIQAGSPAINAGQRIGSISTDRFGDSRDNTPTIGAVERAGGTPPPVTESIAIESPPATLPPSGTKTFSIDYRASGTRDILLNIFDADWTWRAQTRIENVSGTDRWTGTLTYAGITTPTCIIQALLVPDGRNWQDTVKFDSETIEIIRGSAPESISLTAPATLPRSGTETFRIDYSANGTRDILLNIFDSDWTWRGQTRIENVSGSDRWTGTLTYPSIATPTCIVDALLVPDGLNWRDTIARDNLTRQITTASAAPDLAVNPLDGTAGPGVTFHGTWGASGMAPGRWIRLNNVNLSTGYSNFAFQYSSAQSGRLEVRAGSPTGQRLGTCTLNATGGWQKTDANWSNCTLSPLTGTHDIYLVMTEGHLNAFFSWFTNP